MLNIDLMTRLAAQAVQTFGPVGTLVLVLFLLLYVGVVLPTVWSRHSYRRNAARRTMTTLLDYADRLARALRFWRPR